MVMYCDPLRLDPISDNLDMLGDRSLITLKESMQLDNIVSLEVVMSTTMDSLRESLHTTLKSLGLAIWPPSSIVPISPTELINMSLSLLISLSSSKNFLVAVAKSTLSIF